MDWSKTKSILILTFLILNLVFGFQLWIVPRYFDAALRISPEQVEAGIAELRKANIIVQAQIPRRLDQKRMLLLRPTEVDHEKMVVELLGPHVQTPGEDYELFASAQGEVRIFSDGRIIYTAPPRSSSGYGSEELAKAVSEEFVANAVGMPAGARHSQAYPIYGTAYKVEFAQVWRNTPIPISYIRCIVDNAGVLGMEYYWVEPQSLVGDETLAIPATGALIVASDYLPARSIITNIYLSWYSSPQAGEEWRVPAVWVVVSDTQELYINAFTAELEGRHYFEAGNLWPYVE